MLIPLNDAEAAQLRQNFDNFSVGNGLFRILQGGRSRIEGKEG